MKVADFFIFSTTLFSLLSRLILVVWLIRNMGKFMNPGSYLKLNGSQWFNTYSDDSAKQQDCEFSHLCVGFLQEKIE